MDSIPRVKAVMTPFPYSIPVDASLQQAKQMMERHTIRHLPVIRGEELVGVITERDVDEMLRPGMDPEAAAELKVDAARIQESYVVEMNHPLDRVLDAMAQRRIESVLIVKDGRLAGIFTATDACRLSAELLRTSFPNGEDAA